MLKTVISMITFAGSLLISSLGFAAIDGTTYEVPVPAHLKAYAVFQTDAPTLEQKGNEAVIHYTLPPEVVGLNHPGITMTSKNFGEDKVVFESKDGKAVCETVEETVCQIKYEDVEINAEEVRQYLKEKSKSRFEFQQRLKVAMHFRSDPGGILRYQRVKSPSTSY